jgi:serine/threonine protein kinase
MIREIKTLRALTKSCATYVPRMVDYDLLFLKNFSQGEELSLAYYIMPVYDEYEDQCPFTTCRQLLKALEHLHATGRVHNDLKLQNFMFDQNGDVCLIDFGLSKKYSTEELDESRFCGNLIFASEDKLDMYAPTRRDDIYSVAYILIFLVNDQALPIETSSEDFKQLYHEMVKFRKENTLV